MFECLYICIICIDTRLYRCIYIYTCMFISLNRSQWLGVVGWLCPPEAEGPEHPGVSSRLLHKPGRHREAQNQGRGHHQESGGHDRGAGNSSPGEALIETISPPSQCQGSQIHTHGHLWTFDIPRMPDIIDKSKRYFCINEIWQAHPIYFSIFSFCFYFLQCFVCTGSNQYRKPSTNMWDFFVKNANGGVKVCVLF